MKKYLFGLFILSVSLFSCVKTEFDAPNPCEEPDTTVEANTTIAELVAMHTTIGGYDRITEDVVIKGTIMADDRSGNYYKALVLQDETGGIEVGFNDGYLASNGFTIGRTISIKCKDLILTDYRNLPQLKGAVVFNGTGVPTYVGLTQSQRANIIGKGTPCYDPPTPKVMTLAEAFQTNNLNTLITLTEVQFSEADTALAFCDSLRTPEGDVVPNLFIDSNRSLGNCDGQSIIVRTSSYSNFSTSKVPGGYGTVTGILTIYSSTYQLIIRDLNDIQLNDARCKFCIGGVTGSNTVAPNVNEAFSSTTSGQDINLTGWTNHGTIGTRKWRASSFDGNIFAQATAFGSSNPDPLNEEWLVSPPVDVTTQRVLTFESQWAFYRHQGLTVWFSPDFGSNDICSATWIPLEAHIATQADGSGDYGFWVPSGNVNLPITAGGKGWIGFRMVGDKTTNTTNWRIDNVKIQ